MSADFESSADSLLAEAYRLTTADRHAAYGHPLDDWTRTAAMWSAILGCDVTVEQALLCMVAVKVSRLVETPDHRDSMVDVAGYANCYSMVVDERLRRRNRTPDT